MTKKEIRGLEKKIDHLASKVELLIESTTDGQRQNFRIKEAMKYLNVSRQTIYNLVTSGELKASKRGKFLVFSRADLEAYQAGATD